jgi:hypothetical protein
MVLLVGVDGGRLGGFAECGEGLLPDAFQVGAQGGHAVGVEPQVVNVTPTACGRRCRYRGLRALTTITPVAPWP